MARRLFAEGHVTVMIVIGIILFVMSAGCLTLGIMQLLRKGPLINNAWLYADDEQRRTMDKAPYYRQSGIVFSLIGFQFIMTGVFCITKIHFFIYAECAVIGFVVLYAIVSAVMIEKKKKG